MNQERIIKILCIALYVVFIFFNVYNRYLGAIFMMANAYFMICFLAWIYNLIRKKVRAKDMLSFDGITDIIGIILSVCTLAMLQNKYFILSFVFLGFFLIVGIVISRKK